MVVTLTGTNKFVLQAALAALTAEFISEQGEIAVERLDGEEATYDRLRESLQSMPFFASKKMVVLQNASANKKFVEQAEKLLTELPEMTEAVLVEPKLDKRLSYYKFLKKATELRDFSELDENGLAQWLVESAQARGGRLSISAARYLIERVGLDQQLLDKELEKLMLYIPDVTVATINLLTEPAPQSTIFELLDAAFSGNLKRSLAIYNEQRQQKVEPANIIAMLTWQLRSLALIKTAASRSVDSIAKEAKLNPYVIQKAQTAASRITFEHLKQLISDLLTLDVRSKRESIDLDEALQLFLMKIAV
jgi:DNA polymerase-3 subunit delta